jgi:hypothetical protein
MYEKIMLQKYYFKKQFEKASFEEKITLTNQSGEEVETNLLAYAWDNNFFKKLKLILQNEESLFSKIQVLYNLETIFPVDIKKCILQYLFS